MATRKRELRQGWRLPRRTQEQVAGFEDEDENEAPCEVARSSEGRRYRKQPKIDALRQYKDEILEAHRSGLSVHRIAQIFSDPSNSGWQHDLSDAYKGLGVLSKKQGDFTSPQKNFQPGLEILTNLIRLHGDNPTGKTDLHSV